MKLACLTLVLLALAIVSCGDDDAESGENSDAAAAILAYEAAYNSRDIDSIVAVFSEDAVITGNGPDVTGLNKIERVHVGQLTETEGAYSFANFEADGDTVTWNSVWTNLEGESWCQESHSAVVMGGKIVSWAWGTDPHSCE